MIQANITNDYPVMKAYIHHDTPKIKGIINNTAPVIKGNIHTTFPFIVGQIKKAVDHEAEPYYEVSNEYGTTIIIGD